MVHSFSFLLIIFQMHTNVDGVNLIVKFNDIYFFCNIKQHMDDLGSLFHQNEEINL